MSEQTKVRLALGASIVSLLLSAIVCYATWGQYKVGKSQQVLLDRQDHEHAREAFNKALNDLDSVDVANRGCSSDVATFASSIPIAQAIQAEKIAEPLLTAAEYNRFATLVADVTITTSEEYARKANEKSITTPDQFLSKLVLAHIHFCALSQDASSDQIDACAKEFNEAIAVLLPYESISASNRRHIGQAYAILSAHQYYLGKKDQAELTWKKAEPFLTGRCAASSHTTDNLKSLLNYGNPVSKPSISYLFALCEPHKAALMPPALEPEPATVTSPSAMPAPAPALAPPAPPPPKK